MTHDKILILDFGSQVTQLIARRIREAHVYCEIHPNDVSDAFIREFAPKGIVLSGSHASTYEEQDLRAPQAVWDAGVPVLGICYGMFTMTVQQGGQVEASSQREFGYAEVRAHGHTRLLDGIEDFATSEGHGMLKVWMSHGDKVTGLPPGFKLMASTPSCPIAGMADESRGYYGVQFHPEVTHTQAGRGTLLRTLSLLGHLPGACPTLWTAANIIEDAAASRDSQAQVGTDEEVLLGLSGGVDSSGRCRAAQARDRRPARLRLRRSPACCDWQEGDHGHGDDRRPLVQHMGVNVIRVNAAERYFLGALARRRPIPKPSARSSAACSSRSSSARIKPSSVERKVARARHDLSRRDRVGGVAKTKQGDHVIKSHHNVGGLPATLGLKLLEPLRDLFKDEVRELGVALGLPREMVYRHPFPGPGLGVRILGEVKAEYAELLRRADAIFIEELRREGWYDQVSQAFAVFLPVKSVGVMGDGRTYDYVVALRAVTTSDFMTADWAELPYALLKRTSARIINEVRGINRVTYDVSSKPPATIEWE